MIPEHDDLQAALALPKPGGRMPALFIGHGSPMNGIEDNEFSDSWTRLAEALPRPEAVLCISAHWLTRGTFVTAMDRPRTIHDFGGFPPELFAVRYPAPGSAAIADAAVEALKPVPVGLDHGWGLDHGAWTVIRRMYPAADVPVLQLSIDYNRPPRYHYDLGGRLAALRDQGVLLLASGNMVHNLGRIAFDKINGPEYGYDWALEMKTAFGRSIRENDHAALIEYGGFGEAAALAVPTPDHYYPLLYALGSQAKGETAALFNDKAVAGSLTMTSVLIA
jgi:4,5-DOPA dioxygenase extradiol